MIIRFKAFLAAMLITTCGYISVATPKVCAEIIDQTKFQKEDIEKTVKQLKEEVRKIKTTTERLKDASETSIFMKIGRIIRSTSFIISLGSILIGIADSEKAKLPSFISGLLEKVNEIFKIDEVWAYPCVAGVFVHLLSNLLVT